MLIISSIGMKSMSKVERESRPPRTVSSPENLQELTYRDSIEDIDRELEPSEEDSENEEIEAIGKEDAFDILINERRRDILRLMGESEGSEYNVGDLIDEVSAKEVGKEIEELDFSDKKPVYTALRQSHLERMDEQEVINYDSDEGVVETGENFDILNNIRKEDRGEVPADDFYSILKEERRRFVISYLQDLKEQEKDLPLLNFFTNSQIECETNEIIDALASKESGKEVEELEWSDKKAVFVSLNDNSFPKMDDAGVIDYEEEQKTVRPGENFESFEKYADGSDVLAHEKGRISRIAEMASTVVEDFSQFYTPISDRLTDEDSSVKEQLEEEDNPEQVLEYEEEAENMGDVNESLSKEEKRDSMHKDDFYNMLKNNRRRAVLRYVDLFPEELPVEARTLSEEIAAYENDKTPNEISSDERQRVQIALYQTHLGQLDELDLINYNEDRKLIDQGPDLDIVTPELEDEFYAEDQKIYREREQED